jgi:hypothetical protein
LREQYKLEVKNGQFKEAITHINQALAIFPIPIFYNDLSEIYIRQNDFLNAINSAKATIELDKNDFNAWFFLAYSFKMTNQIDDSINAYKKALELKPDSASVYHNLGNIYQKYKNDPISTIECYNKVYELEPENPYVRSCMSSLYLKVKDYKNGWKCYHYAVTEAMKKSGSTFCDVLNVETLWHDENIKDKTLFVHFNGGLGDTIMFARFLPLLKNKCENILFCTQKSLIELFKEVDLGVTILDETFTEDQLKFDYHLPLMDLAYKLQIISEKDIPSLDGYLKANAEKVKHYKEKYFNNNNIKIGIKWRGNMTYAPERHLNLVDFKKLFDFPNTKFYSLQRDDGAEQLEEFKGHQLTDLGNTFENFADTAAAVENLDLVICNDTSVAHLAGAMGKKCWVVLPFVQDWRWSMDMSYCPWYTSVKMFKQSEPDNWDEVFDNIYKELAQHF